MSEGAGEREALARQMLEGTWTVWRERPGGGTKSYRATKEAHEVAHALLAAERELERVRGALREILTAHLYEPGVLSASTVDACRAALSEGTDTP